MVQSILIFHLFRHNSEISHIVGFAKIDQKKKDRNIVNNISHKIGKISNRIAPVRCCHRGLNDDVKPCTDGYGHLGHPYVCLLGRDNNAGDLNVKMIFAQKPLTKQEELVEIIDTTGTGSLIFGEEYEVMDKSWQFENYIFLTNIYINWEIAALGHVFPNAGQAQIRSGVFGQKKGRLPL